MPIYFGADAEAAHGLLWSLTGCMLQGRGDEGRTRARAALRRTIESHDTDQGVTFDSAAWLVTTRRAP